MVDPNQIAQNILQALQQQSVGSGPANHVVRVTPNPDGTVSIDLEHDVVPALIARELATAVARGVAIGIAPFLDGGGGVDDHLIKAAPGDTIFRSLYEKIVQGSNILVQIVDLGVEKKVLIAAVGSSRMPLPDGAGNPGGGPGAGLSWDNHEHPMIDPQTLRGILYAGVIADLLNKGVIVTCYTGGLSCFPYLFGSAWTEISPGVMQKNTTGPLSSSEFDGYDPDPFNPAGSPLLGQRVLAYVGGLDSGELALSGPYIVDDIGGHWDPYDPIEERTWVNTKAILRRDPDFAAGTDFLTGMTFHVLSGTLFGGKYLQLTTSGTITLGVTPLEWDVLTSYTPVGAQFRLLTASQIYMSVTSQVDNVAVPYFGSDDTFHTAAYLDTLTGTPNVGAIPAGKWVFELNCKVHSLAGDTTIQVTLGKEDTFRVQTPIFSEWTTPIRTTDFAVKTVTVDYAGIALSPTDRLYVSFLGRATNVTGIAITMTIADVAHTTRIYTPLDLSVPGSMRHPDLTERFTPNQHDGASISLDTTNFTNNLSAADTTVQLAMETLDQMSGGGASDHLVIADATDPTAGTLIAKLLDGPHISFTLDTVVTHRVKATVAWPTPSDIGAMPADTEVGLVRAVPGDNLGYAFQKVQGDGVTTGTSVAGTAPDQYIAVSALGKVAAQAGELPVYADDLITTVDGTITKTVTGATPNKRLDLKVNVSGPGTVKHVKQTLEDHLTTGVTVAVAGDWHLCARVVLVNEVSADMLLVAQVSGTCVSAGTKCKAAIFVDGGSVPAYSVVVQESRSAGGPVSMALAKSFHWNDAGSHTYDLCITADRNTDFSVAPAGGASESAWLTVQESGDSDFGTLLGTGGGSTGGPTRIDLGGPEVNHSAVPTVLECVALNPATYASGLVWRFQCVVALANSGSSGYVQLYNISDAVSVVTLAIPSGALGVPTMYESVLVVPTDLPLTAKLYEVRFYLASPLPTDKILLSAAYLTISAI